MESLTHISKYAILQRLGTGGMAEVFKCRLSGIGGFDKVVVVKRILPHLMEDEAFVSMFLDEARIAANLAHPNIVQVYEIAQDDDGTPFIAMEYVRGPTLSQVIRGAVKAGDLHPGRMAKLVAGVALGLDSAHNARGPDGAPLNIVHRDISPQNILVSLDGCPKVLDFGVAKADGRLTHTQGGVLKGKVRFMAPEQILDPAAELDRRADVFSLGVCLYICLTGKMPFSGDNDVQVMKAITSGAYQRPSEARPGLPAELEAIIDWTLATRREERCGSCRELSDRLMAYVAAHPEGTGDQEMAAWLTGLFPEMDAESWSGGARTPSGIGGLHTPLSRAGTRAPGGLLAATPHGLRPPTQASGLRVPSGLRPAPDAALVAPEVVNGADGSTTAGVLPASIPAPPSRRPLVLGLAAAVVGVLAVGGYFATRSAPAPAPLPPAPVATPVVAALTSIVPYLDEAEGMLAAGKVRAARGLAERARGVGKVAPAEDIRLARLEAALAVATALEGARQAVDDGQLPQARVLLAEVEREDPENAAAQALRHVLDEKQARLDEEKERQHAPAQPGQPAARTTLALTSTPSGASVLVDGAAVGTTPLAGLALRPGAHVVRVALRGLAPWEERVTATGQPLRLQITLVPEVASPAPAAEAKGRLRVSTSVPATVFIDGVAVGAAPAQSAALVPGPHTVAATAEGYLGASQEVTVKAGETFAVELTLAPVAAPTTPVPSTAAATSTGRPPPQAPGLPQSFNAHTLQDLSSALRTVEMTAVTRGGFEVKQVKNTTALLGAELAGTLSPGTAVEVYPAGMYWFIAHGVQDGRSPQQIARGLKAAHFANELADLAR